VLEQALAQGAARQEQELLVLVLVLVLVLRESWGRAWLLRGLLHVRQGLLALHVSAQRARVLRRMAMGSQRQRMVWWLRCPSWWLWRWVQCSSRAMQMALVAWVMRLRLACRSEVAQPQRRGLAWARRVKLQRALVRLRS
jgi:hypothetical protein